MSLALRLFPGCSLPLQQHFWRGLTWCWVCTSFKIVHRVQAGNGFCCKKLPRVPHSVLRPSQPAALQHLKPPSGCSTTPDLLCVSVLLCAKPVLRTVSQLTWEMWRYWRAISSVGLLKCYGCARAGALGWTTQSTRSLKCLLLAQLFLTRKYFHFFLSYISRFVWMCLIVPYDYQLKTSAFFYQKKILLCRNKQDKV